MKNIIVARVDERVIHGQVATKWVQHTNANVIVAVDDELVHNDMMVKIYKGIAPVGVRVEILTVSEGIEYLSDQSGEDERILLIAKVPQTFLAMAKGGIKFEQIILGAAGFSKEHIQLMKFHYATMEEIRAMKELIDMGIQVIYTQTPDEKKIDVKDAVAKLCK